MRAMILAAGRGERLRPLTERVPKPMIPIGGEPLIVHQLRWLRRAGIEEVVVNLHHLGEQVEGHVGNGGDVGIRVRYSREASLLGTGGGIKRALPLLGDDPFLVLNGDIWTSFAFRDVLGVSPEVAHLVLTPLSGPSAPGGFRAGRRKTTALRRRTGRPRVLRDRGAASRDLPGHPRSSLRSRARNLLRCRRRGSPDGRGVRRNVVRHRHPRSTARGAPVDRLALALAARPYGRDGVSLARNSHVARC